MNTRQMASEYRMAKWAQILQDRKESGESVNAYCKSRGISRDSYFYWQRKLREAVGGKMAQAQASTAQQGLVPAGFTQVQLRTGQWENLDAGRNQRGGLVAEAAGIRLSADCAYPAEKLAYLLRELVSLC